MPLVMLDLPAELVAKIDADVRRAREDRNRVGRPRLLPLEPPVWPFPNPQVVARTLNATQRKLLEDYRKARAAYEEAKKNRRINPPPPQPKKPKGLTSRSAVVNMILRKAIAEGRLTCK